MTQPLALVVYEKLLPGTQLVNRLQDLKFRVRAITEAETLPACAEQDKPMLVIADLASTRADVCAVIRRMKDNPETHHIPVIAIAAEEEALQEAARAAGASLVANEAAIMNHLPEFLEQALRVE